MDDQLFSRYLISLPDTAFFDLFRTYLGPIRTPFNKHDLVRDLTTFLKNEDVQKRIVTLLDEDDRRWLTIIGFAEPLPPERMQQLFIGELSPIEIHQRVLNLEDRLLIISDPDSGDLRLNPLLAPLLHRSVVRQEQLLPIVDHGDGPPPHAPVDSAALFAFAAWFRYPRDIYRQSGGLRKREYDQLRSLFPRIPERGVLGSALESIITGLIALQLLQPEGSQGYSAQPPAWQRFFALPHPQRISYLTAAMIAPDHSQIESAAACTSNLLEMLTPGSRCTRAALREIVRFVHAAGGLQHAAWGEDILRSLETLGVLVRDNEDLLTVAVTATAELRQDTAPRQDTEPAIVVQPSFEVTFTHNADYSAMLPLTALLDPIRCDVYPHFELTRDRCLRSLTEDSAAIELLHSLSSGSLPQNVAMSLELWQSEGQSIALYTGTVLVADEERKHLIEHHQELSKRILHTLAPGVFLMRGSQQEIQQSFADAGLGFLPGHGERARSRKVPVFPELPPAPFSIPEAAPGLPAPAQEAEQPEQQPAGEDLAEIDLRVLNERIDNEIKDEYQREMLRRRVSRKLVLLPHQIDPGYLPNERTEARGLDYLGKVRLLERILQSSSDLAEVTERDRSGKPVRRLIRPTKLSPSGSELFLSGLQLPGGEPIRLAVRKMSLVRKVRSGFNPRLIATGR